jgi:hypothetical protein
MVSFFQHRFGPEWPTILGVILICAGALIWMATWPMQPQKPLCSCPCGDRQSAYDQFWPR